MIKNNNHINFTKYFLLSTLAGWINREQANVIVYLLSANHILKKKLEADGKRIKYSDAERARLARKGRMMSWRSLVKFSSIVTPETIIRWHNRFVAKKYDSSKTPRKSSAKLRREHVAELICRMAKDNTSWGAGKVVGALKHVGIIRSRSTVAKVMKQNGFDPKPRGEKTRINRDWNNFIKTHLSLMSACDFFTQEVWTLRGLIRYLVFFVVDCKSRKVKIVHISPDYDSKKMERIALGMTDCFDGVLKDKRFLFCDKDPLYTSKFRKIMKDSGVEVHQVPSPVCNPYAERFVKSIKHECLNHLVFFGEKQLRYAINEYEEYFNSERPHQNLDNKLIAPESNKHISLTKSNNSKEYLKAKGVPGELIVKNARLGGLLNFYYRKTG